MRQFYIFLILIIFNGPLLNSQAFPEWTGSGSNWSDPANWTSTYAYGQLQFLGGGNTTSNNDFSPSTAQWRLFFQNSVSYTLTGNPVNLSDFGGANSWILSQSTVDQNIDLSIVFSDGGVRPGWITTQNTGNLIFNGNLSTTNGVNALYLANTVADGRIIVNGTISGDDDIFIGRDEIFGKQTTTSVEFSGANSYSGDTFIDGGSLRTSGSGTLGTSADVFISAGTTLFVDNTLTVQSVQERGSSDGGTIDLSGGNLVVDGGWSGERFQNTITGSGNLVKNGTGIWTLYGDNTYTGTTTINSGGVIRINNINGLGTTDGVVTVNSGAALELNGAGDYPAQNLVISGTGLSDDGALRKIDSSPRDYPGNITLNSDSRINVIGGTLDFIGDMDANGNTVYFGGILNFEFESGSTLINASKTTGDGAIFKDGSGRLKIRPSAEVSGNVTLVDGEIRQATGTYASTGTLILRGGTYRSDAGTGRTIPKNVSVEGDFTLGHSSGTTGSMTIDGNVDLTGATRTITMSNDNSIDGIISNGGLSKDGAGILSLGAANTYTGATTILAGTLQLGVGGDLADATDVRISGGATFDLNDQDVTVASVAEAGAADSGTVDLGSGTLTLEGWTGDLFQNSMTGTGNLVKNGTGVLDLFGTQDYSGTTTINGGTIRSNVDLSSSEIIVNSGGTFTQRTTADIAVNDLTINSGGTLDIPTGRTLTVNGVLEIDADAILALDGTLAFGASGRLVITGSSDFLTTDALFPGSSGPADFEINHTGNVTLHATRTLTGEVEVVNGNLIINEGIGLTAASLENNGSVQLESSSLTYASLIVNTVTGTGTVTYNRFVNSEDNGRDLIASPVTQTWSNFLGAGSNETNILDDGNSSPTTYLFGPFNNASGLYENLTDASSVTLTPGVGYRAATNTAPLDGTGTTLEFTGSITTGDPSVDLFQSINSFWNLLGNPYTSYLDTDAFLAENVTNNTNLRGTLSAVYGYNATGTGNDVWTVWDLNPPANGLIAPGQGFFVAAPDGGGTSASFTLAMRTTGTDDDFIANRNVANSNNFAHAILNMSTSSESFVTNVFFRDFNTRGLDPGYDTGAFNQTANGVYSYLVEDNTGVALFNQSLPYADLTDIVVPIVVNLNPNQQITFSLNGDSVLPAGIDVFLDDVVDNTVTLLNTGTYTLTPSTTLSGGGRFFLRFASNALSISQNDIDGLQIFSNVQDRTIVIAGELNAETTAVIFDMQGRMVKQVGLDANLLIQAIGTDGLSSGVYVVQLSNGTQSKTEKVILR